MAYFKDKEDYLKWVQKKKRKRKLKAATKKGPLEKPGDFRFPKILLKRPGLFLAPPFLLGALLLGFYSLSSERDRSPAKGFPPPQRQIHRVNSKPRVANPPAPSLQTATPSLANITEKAPKALALIKTTQGMGCGFFISNDGLIITSAHILGKSDEAEVYLHSGEVRIGVVLKKLSPPVDIALLQIDGSEIESLPLANSDYCQEGEEVVALGFPPTEKWQTSLIASRGTIRSCNESYQGIQYLQVENALKPENDGGPILNRKGEVIGISKGDRLPKGAERARVGLAINVVKGLADQRSSLMEERIKKREKFYQYVYEDLWAVASNEYQVYQQNLYDPNQKGERSTSEAYRLEKKALNPPEGSPSLKNWVSDLTERVVNGELSKEKASAMVKEHFAI